MSDTLVESASYDATITVPTDGDTRNAASVRPGFQSLANRTSYLNSLTGSTGIKRIQGFADFAALRAYRGQADGDVCVVTGYGIYRFLAAILGNTEVVPTAIVPSGGTAGRWRLIGAGTSSLNVANGIGQLDTNAKLPAANTHGGLVDVFSWFPTSLNVAAPGVDTVVHTSDPQTYDVGDQILILGTLKGRYSSGSGIASWSLSVTGPATPTGSSTSVKIDNNATTSGGTTLTTSIHGHYVITTAGAYSFVLTCSPPVGTTAVTNTFLCFVQRYSA